VKDINFEMKAVTVRSGKGDKDRVTTLSTSMIPLLKNHFAKVKVLHEADLAPGHGEVYLTHALARTYPGAGREWGCSMFFPPAIFRRPTAPEWPGAIMWMPVWSTKL
jgi:integrase